MLNLFCIGKVHQLIKFGISFRKVFQIIDISIVSLLCNTYCTFNIPVRMMTATLDHCLYLLLQCVLGLSFDVQNICGTMHVQSFSKRNINIKMKYSVVQTLYQLCWGLQNTVITAILSKQ